MGGCCALGRFGVELLDKGNPGYFEDNLLAGDNELQMGACVPQFPRVLSPCLASLWPLDSLAGLWARSIPGGLVLKRATYSRLHALCLKPAHPRPAP